MEQEQGGRRRRLPGYDEDWTAPGQTTRAARQSRDEGVRRVRRMSNWTAAALIAAAAATTGYFAHATAAAPAAGYSGAVTSGQQGTPVNGHKPSLTHPVVTSGGSGVVAGSSGSGGSGGVASTWRDN